MSLSPEIQALLAAPALVPPTGITADFDNPPNKNYLAWIVTTLCMAFATFSVIIRGGAARALRICSSDRSSWQGVTLTATIQGAYWCTAYAGYKMIFYPGYYVHQWNLRNGDLVEPFYLILIYGCAYSATMTLVKTAILIDWCRFFVIGDSRTGYFLRISAFLVCLQIVWGILCIILLNTQCVPHAAIWKFYLPSKCYSLPKVMLTSASTIRKKIGVSVVFGVGLLMYFIGPLLFWACAEMTCGFFILSVPCMPSVVKHSGLPGLIDSFRSQGSKFSSSRSSNLRNAVSHTSDLPSRKTSRAYPDPQITITTSTRNIAPCHYKLSEDPNRRQTCG
ncbi:hypothetical protein E4T42_06126 [Aureobasidium subglaciale]|nr:hypothetical protein E4T42_06126 [Aureobasidium subglaciale]